MHTFPIALLLAIEKGVFVLGPHLRLLGHFRLPSLDRFRRRRRRFTRRGERQALQGRRHGRDHIVHHSQPFALARFLGSRHSPWDFPAEEGVRWEGDEWGMEGGELEQGKRGKRDDLPEETTGKRRGGSEGT